MSSSEAAQPAAAARRNGLPVGTVVIGCALGGALAGAATGAIDALWSWRDLSQFLPTVVHKLRLVWFLALCYAIAGLLLGAAGALVGVFFARVTRLGELARALAEAHRRVRARDPRDALVGLSLTIAGVPLFAALLAGGFVLGHQALALRRHAGLVIASSMGIALVALAGAALLTFALARPIEAGLRRLAEVPRLAGPLSSPWAPAVAALWLCGTAGAVAVSRAWETLSLLPLRPLWITLVGLALAAPAIGTGRRLAARLAARRALVRRAVPVALLLVMAALMIRCGEREDVRKATFAYTGLGGPLVQVYRNLGDFDRDGYSRILGGGDCNDWDPTIHPGAVDIPDDGIDQSCTGFDATLKRPPEDVAFATLPPSVPERPNIVLITIDTIRSDHVGAYGYHRDTTPNLDRVAAEGTLFVNAWAHAPSTRYSIPAILTGRYPLNVHYDHSLQGWPGLLEKSVTIAEVLADRGYATWAVLNHWYFDEHRRMNQGFDVYDNTNKRLHMAVPGQGPAHTRGSSSKEQTDRAVELLRAHESDQPFFLWVHYYDPHYEYQPRPDVPSFGTRKIDLYDGEIRFTDLHIGRLFDELRRQGRYDDTALVITGDHGEGFGEKGIELHGYHLYAPQTRVPMIVRVPGVAPIRATTPVGHVDILPTIANLAGGAPHPDMMGRSLVDIITGQASADEDRWIFQQLSFENNNEQRGAASQRCHVIYNVSPNTSWELYRIDIDPLETRDVIDDPGPCADARDVLAAWYDFSELPYGAADALLSGRPDIADPVSVRFGDEVELIGVELPAAPVRRGEAFEVTLTFAAHGRLPPGWKVFLHFARGEGVDFQGDHPPARPFEWWSKGQHIRYAHTVTVPRNARPGTYTLWMGLFRGGERAPARGDARIIDDRVVVGAVEVAP